MLTVILSGGNMQKKHPGFWRCAARSFRSHPAGRRGAIDIDHGAVDVARGVAGEKSAVAAMSSSVPIAPEGGLGEDAGLEGCLVDSQRTWSVST